MEVSSGMRPAPDFDHPRAGSLKKASYPRVERPFHFIEGNFLAGRTFGSWEDLNQRARGVVR